VKPGQPERVDHTVSAARQHHIHIAIADGVGRFAHGLAAADARRRKVGIRSPRIEQTGNQPRRRTGFQDQTLVRTARFLGRFQEVAQIEILVVGRRRRPATELSEIRIDFATAGEDPDAMRVDVRFA
jgi:hypothetical protein